MKKMKISKREILLLIVLVGVLSIVAVYVWVFIPYNTKTLELEAENANQAVYVAQLEDWSNKTDELRLETQQMIQEVNTTLSRFPAESKEEDAIMYAVELESQDPQTYISAIGLSQPELIYEATPTTVKLSEFDEQSEHTYRLYSQQITYTQEFSYNGMKRYVDSIVNNSERKSIETLNMAYDANTGILVGNTAMNIYTLGGTEKEYHKTDIPRMPMGTDNIFGTLEQNNVDEE